MLLCFCHENQPDGGYIELFNIMFANHPVPDLFLHNLESLTCVDVECLMFVAAGNDIIDFDRLPYPISQEELLRISQFTSFQFIFIKTI